MAAVPDLQTLEYKLRQRGFKRGDAQLLDCPDCKERALLKYIIAGRVGGRDISLCQACGVSRSWRNIPGGEERVEEKGFDLRKFLG